MVGHFPGSPFTNVTLDGTPFATWGCSRESLPTIQRPGGGREPNMKSRTGVAIVLTVLFVTVGLSRPTFAYVDLGTGSYLLQLLLAGFFGIAFSTRSLIGKVRAYLSDAYGHKRR